jgi:hypothetical protein
MFAHSEADYGVNAGHVVTVQVSHIETVTSANCCVLGTVDFGGL